MESTLLGNLANCLNGLAMGNLKSANVTQYNGKSIALKGSSVQNFGDDLYLTVNNNPENISIIKSKKDLRIETLAEIKIPAETLIKKDLAKKMFFSYAFKDDRFFVKSNNDDVMHKQNRHQKVESIIMSLKFINRSVKDLEHPIQLKFEVSDSTDKDGSECSYWNEGMVNLISTFFFDEKNSDQFTNL